MHLQKEERRSDLVRWRRVHRGGPLQWAFIVLTRVLEAAIDSIFERRSRHCSDAHAGFQVVAQTNAAVAVLLYLLPPCFDYVVDPAGSHGSVCFRGCIAPDSGRAAEA